MANPTEYSRDYSFSGFQANNPQTPLSGPKVDEELDNLGLSVNQTISGLKDIRRADGALRNGIVTAEAMAPGIITGLNPATEWQAGKQYFVNDTVFYQVAFYRCLESHVSNADFTVDLAASRWEKYADLAPIVTDAEIARDEAVAARGTAVAAAGTATSAASAASADASTASGAAASAAASATSAAASYDLFDDRYLGEKTSLPTLDNDGNALVNGALVSLTGQVDPQNDGMYVRRSGAWQKMFASTNVLLNYARFSASDGNLTAGQTTFVISGGYIAGYADVYRNGLKLVNGVDVTITSGTQIVLAVGVGGTDTLEFEGYRVLDSGLFADQPTAEAGTSATTLMSPLSTAQQITARIGTAAGTLAAGDDSRFSFTQAGVGAVTRTVQDKLRDVVNAKDFGAVGDGVTNDRAAIQAALDAVAASGGGKVVLSGRHLVETSLSVPENVALEGPKGVIGHIDGAQILSLRPSVILNSAATITLANASHVRNLLIYRKGLAIPCTSADTALFAGKAITLPNGTADMVLENLMILGFEYAVWTDTASANTSRIRIERMSIDCTNGIYSKSSFDVCYIREVHCWPFCSSTAPAETNNAQNRRNGAALYFDGPHDWAEVSNFLSYGYARGIRLNNVDNTVIMGGAADGPPPSASYLDGHIGLLIEGNSNEVTVIGHRIATKQYGFWVNSENDGRHDIQFIGCRALACVTTGFKISRGRTHLIGGGVNGFAVGGNVGVTVDDTNEECRMDNMSFVSLATGVNNAVGARSFHRDCNFTSVTTNVVNPYVMSQAAADPMNLDGETLVVSITAGAGSFGTLNNPADYAGKIVTLKFNSALTIISGGNMKLNGNANFVTTANDVLVLLSDGTQWLEVARSANP